MRFGSFLVKGNSSLVDKLQELTGAGSTIFELRNGVPIRLSTTVRKPDSQARNVGTPLSGPAREAFDAGQAYTGVVTVAGQPFIAKYYMLKDASGKTIGLYSTNFSLAQMVQAVSQTTQIVLIIAVVCLAVLLIPVFLVSRNVSQAIAAVRNSLDQIVSEDVSALTQTLGRLASGDLTASFASNRATLKIAQNDEIADLTRSSNALSSALSTMAKQYMSATHSLRILISGVAQTSKLLAAASDVTSAAARQSSMAVNQIAQAVDLVASGAQDQAGKITDTTVAIEELSRTAEQIAGVATHQAESIALTTAALQVLDSRSYNAAALAQGTFEYLSHGTA